MMYILRWCMHVCDVCDVYCVCVRGTVKVKRINRKRSENNDFLEKFYFILGVFILIWLRERKRRRGGEGGVGGGGSRTRVRKDTSLLISLKFRVQDPP